MSLEEYLQMKVKGLSSLYCPTVCLTSVFQLTFFTVLPYLESSAGPRVYHTAILYLAFPVFFEEINQNGCLCKCNLY